MRQTIVTCFPISEQQAKTIEDSTDGRCEVILSDQNSIASDMLIADIFCGHAKVPVDWQKVVQKGKLKWIQSSAAGLDHCLVSEVVDSDIQVSGCSGLFAPQVAEQTLALLLGLVRSFPQFYLAQKKREFIRRPTDNLEEKRVLILGFGGNGQQIARVLNPLVKSMVASDCFPDPNHTLLKNGTVEKICSDDTWEVELEEADVVIVTVPISKKNQKMISHQQFTKFKKGSYLINVGRGSVIDTEALTEHASLRTLAGIGIDVVDPEPLPADSTLWDLENVLISPHVGAQSPRRIPVTIELFCKNLNRYLRGESLLNLVDKKLGFPRPEHRIDYRGQI